MAKTIQPHGALAELAERAKAYLTDSDRVEKVRDLWVNHYTGAVLKPDDFTPAELRRIADEIEAK